MVPLPTGLMDSGSVKGLIFDVQAHSVHDGPGSRTLVFLSGCPLRCSWCCNPEGLLLRPRLIFKPRLCSNCPHRCVAACPSGAIVPSSPDRTAVALDREWCDVCESFDCTTVCYRSALQISGRWYTVDELMRILNRDRQFWGSRGGVTFSGGEPLLQREFIKAVLARCRESYIQTAMETTCHSDAVFFQTTLPLLDWLFADIKHMDPVQHRDGTGVDNALILSNIRAVAASGWKGHMIIRVPVIPDFNDSVENAEATALFVKECGLTDVNLLPFHGLGASKYDQLGTRYRFTEVAPPSPARLSRLVRIYEAARLSCWLGSGTPF